MLKNVFEKVIVENNSITSIFKPYAARNMTILSKQSAEDYKKQVGKNNIMISF